MDWLPYLSANAFMLTASRLSNGCTEIVAAFSFSSL